MTDSTSDKQNELWQDCAAGSLREFSALARARRLRGRLSWAAGMAAAACILVAAIAYSPFSPLGSVNPPTGDSNFQAPAYPRYGGLSCRDVLHRLDAYFAKDVTPDQRGRIQQHLHDCPACRERFQQAADARGVPLLTFSPLHRQAQPFRVRPLCLPSFFLASR